MDDRNADFPAAFQFPERCELCKDQPACSFELVCEADAKPRRTPDEYRRSTNVQPDGMASSGSHAVGYLNLHQMGKTEPSSRYPAPQPARRCTEVDQGTAISRFHRVGPERSIVKTIGFVESMSGIEATSDMDYLLAEREALLALGKQALAMGANAIVGLRKTNTHYDQAGSQWRVSRVTYLGTAVVVRSQS